MTNNQPDTSRLRGILIDPVTQTVRPVRIDTTDPDRDALRQMYDLLGCSTVTAVTIHEWPDESDHETPGPGTVRETLWLDDEGRLEYPNPLGYFRLKRMDGGADLFCGRGLILATSPDGESWPSGLPLAAVRDVVQFLDEPPTEHEAAPRLQVVPMPNPGEATH